MSVPTPQTRLKIGDLAGKTGKTVRALRLYEEQGLLRPARSEGGFRLYGADEIARVYWITKLQDMGFSLAQIRGLVETVEASATAPEAMHSVRELFAARLAATRLQVERLLELERDLKASLAYLEGCSACTHDHQVDGCITCDSVSHVDQSPPSLVAGIHLSNPVGLRRPQSKPKSKPSNLAGKLAPAIATSTTTKLIDPQS